MAEKKLPIFDAPIVGLQFFPLNIIFDDERIMPWFYCNYIQLEWLEDWCIIFSLLEKYYVGIPFIDKQVIIRDTIANVNVDPIDFFISNIDQGWYTQLSLDEFYIPNKLNFKKAHYIHDNMICGYDSTQRKFTLFGYDDTRKLGVTYAGFDEVKDAYISLGNMIYPKQLGRLDYYNTIFLLRKNKEATYSLDISCMKELLIDYLQGNDYSLKYKMIFNIDKHKTYGINIYEKLSFEFANQNELVINNYRLLHTIYEHKKVMVMRVKYLIYNNIIKQNDMLLSTFIYLEETALMLRTLQLKYRVKKDISIITKISNTLLEMKDNEVNAINDLLVLLQ